MYDALMGKYLIQFLHDNNHILIIYHYNANAISAELLKNNKKGTIVKGYMVIHKRLTNCEFKPEFPKPNNKFSCLLTKYHQLNIMYLQLTPPHMHQ